MSKYTVHRVGAFKQMAICEDLSKRPDEKGCGYIQEEDHNNFICDRCGNILGWTEVVRKVYYRKKLTFWQGILNGFVRHKIVWRYKKRGAYYGSPKDNEVKELVLPGKKVNTYVT